MTADGISSFSYYLSYFSYHRVQSDKRRSFYWSHIALVPSCDTHGTFTSKNSLWTAVSDMCTDRVMTDGKR